MEEKWFYFSIALSSLLFLSFLSKLFSVRRASHRNLPPSPLPLPIIGHLHLTKSPVHRSLQKLSDRYGLIFSLYFGSRYVLVVSSPSAVEECFTKNDIVFANRPRLLAGKHFHYNFTTIGAASYGQHWRNLRRFTALEIFSTSRLNSFLSIRQEEVIFLVKNLFQTSQQNFVKVEMKSRLSELREWLQGEDTSEREWRIWRRLSIFSIL